MNRRPLPAQDALWLALDTPTNQLVITGLMWTATRVDPCRLRELVEDRLLARYPVFRQRPVLDTHGAWRSALWEDDPAFDLDRHLTVRPMPAPRTRATLERHVAAQRSRPFDPAHPRWSVELLQGYRGGSALVQRYHHCIADGIRLTEVMLGMLDPLEADPATPARTGLHAPDGRPAHHLGGLVRRLGGGPVLAAAAAASAVLPAALRPHRALDGALGAAATLAHTADGLAQLATWSNPPGALAGPPGVDKAAAWGEPVPLDLLSRVAHVTGTTVNDVCLALLAGAVARYLAARGGAGDPPDLGWMVPVNLEPLDRALPPELGNHFALVLVVLPHGIRDFGARLAEVHQRVRRIRDSFEPQLTAALQSGIARLPDPLATAAAGVLAAKTVGVLTNVPGPARPMSLAGARVDGVVGWAPCTGPQTVTVCIFSYAGQVTVGFGTDRAAVPDPEWLVAAFDAEVHALTAARAAAPEGSPS